MAAGDVIEQYRLRGVNEDSGVVSRQRGFRVLETTVDVARTTVGIPQAGDEHPDDSSLIASRISTTHEGRDSIVTVSYAPRDYYGGSIPPQNTFAEGFVGVDTTFDDVTVDLPLLQLARVQLGDEEKLVYERIDDVLPFEYSRNIYRIPISVQFQVQGSFTAAMLIARLIGSQINKLHTINGVDLLFKPEGMTQRGPGEFKALYRWYEDPGIPNTLNNDFTQSDIGNRQLRYIGPTIYPIFDDDYVMPPFKGLRVDPNGDQTQSPTTTYFDRYARDPNGWTNLPGVV